MPKAAELEPVSRPTRSAVLFYIGSMTLVVAIVFLAVLWCHINHIRRGQGPYLIHLWGTHGVHLFDLAVLGVELVLVALLLAGFSRRAG